MLIYTGKMALVKILVTVKVSVLTLANATTI